MCVCYYIYIHVFEDLYDILLLELTLGPRSPLEGRSWWIPLFQETFAQKPPVVLSNPYTPFVSTKGRFPLKKIEYTRKEHLKKEN